MKYKTIRIYETSFEKLDEFCDKYSVSKTQLIEKFILFFEKTKIDPRDISDVSAEVKKLKNQLISFIRTQEKERLDPMLKKQDILINEFSRVINEEFVSKAFLVEMLNDLGNTLIKNLKE